MDIRFLQHGEEDALLAFIKEMFPNRPGKWNRTRWDWQFAQNPQAGGKGYTTLVAWDGDRIVGQRPLMPIRLCIDGETVDAVWAPDFMVHPDCRGKGVGSALIERALDLKKVYIAIASSAAPLHVYDKFSAMRLPDVERFARIHRMDDAVNRRITTPGLRQLIARLGNAFLSLRHRKHRCSTTGDILLQEIAGFDVEFDELSRGVNKRHLVALERSASFLCWRFGRASGGVYRTIAARRKDRLVGYAITRESSPGRFLISDVWSSDADASILDALIGACTERIDASPASQQTACFASHRAVKESLLRLGFTATRGGGLSLVVHPGRTSVDWATLAQADHWYVTAADSDVDSLLRWGE